MRITDLIEIIDGRVAGGVFNPDSIVTEAFASDLMSDVLTLENVNPILITGLCNLQTIRTAEMADIKVVVIARGKICTSEMKTLAEQNNITIIETPFSVFRTSGLLYQNGIKPLF
jgi:predicted transcriptional regulator